MEQEFQPINPADYGLYDSDEHIDPDDDREAIVSYDAHMTYNDILTDYRRRHSRARS